MSRVAALALVVLAGCATTRPGAPAADGAGVASVCPTPSDERIESPLALTGRDLLQMPRFFDLMLAHGSVENLEAVLATAARNPGFASPRDVARVEDALLARRTNACADVPFYIPYLTDTPIDGLDLGVE